MSESIGWIAAEAERNAMETVERRGPENVPVANLPAHTCPKKTERGGLAEGSQHSDPVCKKTNKASDKQAAEPDRWWLTEDTEEERARRIYRGRTVAMLRRYMRYSIETGRLPSLIGREFFRSKVTAYSVVTFEDRVIFVHDMESCLTRLDEFSRQLLARHILEEHDQEATARLLDCGVRTVRTYVPMALDLLSDILLEVGLLDRIESMQEKYCQGGLESRLSISDSEDGKNKF